MPYHDAVLDSKKPKMKEKKIFVSKNVKTLSKSDLNKLEKHKETHSPKHINLMKKLMKEGMTFSAAHKEASKKIKK